MPHKTLSKDNIEMIQQLSATMSPTQIVRRIGFTDSTIIKAQRSLGIIKPYRQRRNGSRRCEKTYVKVVPKVPAGYFNVDEYADKTVTI